MENVAASTEITSENSEKQFMMLQEMKKGIEDVVSTILSLSSEMDETASYASHTIQSVKVVFLKPLKFKIKWKPSKHCLITSNRK